MSTERDTFDAALKTLMVAEDCIDDGHRTVYFRDYLGGEQPRHITLGLIAFAQAHEAHGALYGDEDDEP